MGIRLSEIEDIFGEKIYKMANVAAKKRKFIMEQDDPMLIEAFSWETEGPSSCFWMLVDDHRVDDVKERYPEYFIDDKKEKRRIGKHNIIELMDEAFHTVLSDDEQMPHRRKEQWESILKRYLKKMSKD